MVVRNHQGLVLTSLSKKVKLSSSIDDVEAMTIVRALSFTSELGLSFIIHEED